MSSSERLFARPVLYDDERSPSCRKARMAVMAADLDVEIRPCPPGGERFRAEVAELARGAEPPVLVDPNLDVTLTDADEIVGHIRRRYGPSGDVRVAPGSAPSALELFAYETCPYCAIVRVALSKLELPYTLRSMGPGSRKRDGFRARYGRAQFPFLSDSSTGTELFESADIIRYLERQYRRH